MTTDGGRRALAAACTLTAALALGACGGDDGSDLPAFDGSASAAPTTSKAAPTASSTTSAVPDVSTLKTGELVVSRNLATGTEQEAAAEAWIGYWTARIEAYSTADPTVEGLAKHSRGEALSSAVSYINQTLRPSKLHVAGGALLAVNAVTVTGQQATVTSCMRSGTFNADAQERPVEAPTPFYVLTGTLTPRAGSWVVTTLKAEATPCEFQ